MFLRILAVSAFALSLSFCTKEAKEIVKTPTPNDQKELLFQHAVKPVLFEYTSTGCPGCGSWGKPTFNTLSQEFENSIVPVAVHIKYFDPMITTTSNALAANRYGQNYTPQLWVNDTNGVVLSGNINAQASIQRLKDLIEINKQSTAPLLDGKLTLGEDSLTFELGVKSQESVQDIYLSVYLSEDGIKNQQAGSSTNPATHNNVIRSDYNGPFGEMLLAEDFIDGIFTKEVNMEIPKYVVKQNAFVTMILWQKVQNRYVAVNALIVKP